MLFRGKLRRQYLPLKGKRFLASISEGFWQMEFGRAKWAQKPAAN
jgi:hypothetical protein